MTCFNDKIIAVTSGLVLLVIMVRHFAFESWGAGCPPNHYSPSYCCYLCDNQA